MLKQTNHDIYIKKKLDHKFGYILICNKTYDDHIVLSFLFLSFTLSNYLRY